MVSQETFHRVIDGRTRELVLLPRVCWLVIKGTAVRVKVNALLCLSKTFHFFQVRAVVDKVSDANDGHVMSLSVVVHLVEKNSFPTKHIFH